MDVNQPMNEVFISPEHALKRPNEVILKLAFNESGVLGLISSYQDVGNTTVFIGINVSDNTVWLSQNPLALKVSLDPTALANIVNVIATMTAPESPIAPHNVREAEGPNDPRQQFPPFFLGSLFQALGGMPKPFFGSKGNHPHKKYFGSPDFKKSPPFKFDMDGFMEEFDATDDENTDPPDFEDHQPFNPNPDEDS